MSEWVFSDRTQRSRVQLPSCVRRSHRSRGFFAIRITKRGGAKRTWAARGLAVGDDGGHRQVALRAMRKIPHTRDGLRGNALRTVVQL